MIPLRAIVAPVFALVGALALVTTAACSGPPGIGGPCQEFNTLAASGNNPCKEQFYFPSGLTVDPNAHLLYVTNGNSDLRYAGGTLSAVDLDFYGCALDFAKALAKQGTLPDAPTDAVCARYSKIAIGANGADGFVNAYVVADYSTDSVRALSHVLLSKPRRDGTCPVGMGLNALVGGTPVCSRCASDLNDAAVIECDETPFIVDAVRIGNFGGQIRVQTFDVPGSSCAADATPVTLPDGRTACRSPSRRLWLTVRGDPSVTYVPTLLDQQDPRTVKLQCQSPDPAHPSAPVACSNERILIRDFHDPNAPGVNCASGTMKDPSTCVQLPSEPFGLSLDQGFFGASQSGAGAGAAAAKPYARLVLSHLANGEITLIDAAVATPQSTAAHPPPDDQRVVLDVRSGFFGADSAGRHGAFAVSPRVPGDPHSLWYVTSRVNPIVAMFRITDDSPPDSDPHVYPYIVPAGGFSVGTSAVYAAGDDVRDFVFDDCAFSPNQPANPGCRAFFIDNSPPTVFTVDTRIDYGQVPAGVPRNKVTDIVDVCQGPSHLRMQHFTDPATGGAITRLYVVCYANNQIAVIDPDLSRVLDIIQIGRGPNDVAFNFGPGILGSDGRQARPCGVGATGGGCVAPRAYVTTYLDMNITVLDLQPGSPTENRVIGRIGATQPPAVQM